MTSLVTRRSAAATAIAIFAAFAAPEAPAAEPDYSAWNALLAAYYHPAHGMDYAALKKKDKRRLDELRQRLGRVDVQALDRNQQLAFWINLYNVNVVALIVDRHPVRSIRDLSTDPFIRLNVFKKKSVPFGNGRISLDHIENEEIRKRFRDPRIHFAINCAAKSCPPIRPEAYVGSRVGEQLDDQVRKFVAGPGVRIGSRKGTIVVTTTKIMDWFADDFEQWSGGSLAFLQRYLPPEKRRVLAAGKPAEIAYTDYDWSLNDWKR